MKIQADQLILKSKDAEKFSSYDPGVNGFVVANALGDTELNYSQVKRISVPEEYIHLQKMLDDQRKYRTTLLNPICSRSSC